MSKTLLGIAWASWHNIGWFLLLIPIACILYWRYKKQKNAVALLSTLGNRAFVLRNFSLKRSSLKALLALFGFLFIFTALLQPQWDKKDELIEQEGRDLFIALDVSRSMLAQDLSPDRLSFAKAKIRALLAQLHCERVGLILFSGSTFVQCPLTADYPAFYMFLDQVDAQTISGGTTAIDAAIKKALEVFNSMQAKKNKLLIILTDGEDFSSNLASIKKEARQAGLTIFALGIGTPQGAPVPLINDEGKQVGHQLDARGTVVISQLNEGILSALTADVGGVYLKATEDNSDVQKLISYVQRFEKEKFSDKKIAALQERYNYFVGAAFVLFALEWFL